MTQYQNQMITFNTVNPLPGMSAALRGRVVGVLDYETARIVDPNVATNAVAIAPFISSTQPTNYTKYSYMLVETESGKVAIAEQWIEDGSLTVLTENVAVFEITADDSATVKRVTDFLYSNGITFKQTS